MANFLVGLLIYMLPKETVAKMIVILLEKVASLTPTKLDDELVETLKEATHE